VAHGLKPSVLALLTVVVVASAAPAPIAYAAGPADRAGDTPPGKPQAAEPKSPTRAIPRDRQAGVSRASTFGAAPISFEVNRGQTDSSVAYLARGSGSVLFLTGSGATLSLQAISPPRGKGKTPVVNEKAILTMTAVGAAATMRISASDPLPGRVNYYIGSDPRRWLRGIPTYATVTYHDVYPGIDMVFHGTGAQLEYDFVVHPGADPGRIALRFGGAGQLTLDAHGNLALGVGRLNLRQAGPSIHTTVGSRKVTVAGGYVLKGTDVVGFRVGNYDRSRTLTIDPVLVYTTFVGGSSFDAALGIAVDPQKEAVIAGYTQSIDFPTAPSVPTPAIGTITEFGLPTPNSVPEGITAGPDGNLWFAEYAFGKGNQIGRMTPAGTLTEFAATANSGPFWVTAGPDANMWFTETTANKIGTMSTSGTGLTEYAVPTANSAPDQITVGPGGTLWFTEFSGDRIAEITTAGAITEFALTAGSGPSGIIAGPDGNLWFVEQQANKVGNITTAGTVTEFAVPTAASTPAAIAAGPDGNLWFTEFGANKIGRITTAGTLTEFTLPTANSGPGNITAGPDGNLWFTEENTSRVGRITPSGIVTESGLTPSGGSAHGGITTGPDGIWFAEALANQIGRVTVTPFLDAFVTKLNATGTGLVFSTYFGGSGFQQASGVGVDSLGNAYAVGHTTATDFPTTAGASQTVYGGGAADAFVSKFNAADGTLGYSTLLGGSAQDIATALAVDGAGDAYAVGTTVSTNFPTTSGSLQPTYGTGSSNAFVSEVTPSGAALVYSTFLGNTSTFAFGVALDSSGAAYVTGQTNSPDLATTGSAQATLKGPINAYVVKITAGGSAKAYATYAGGSAVDGALAITVDSSGNAYATGQTSSTDFPTTSGAFQTAIKPNPCVPTQIVTCAPPLDAFVTKINPSGSGFVYSTYLGGSNNDAGLGIAVDASNHAIVAGGTSSPDFPAVNSLQPYAGGGATDAFVTRLFVDGSNLVYSTFLGGAGLTEANGIALDAVSSGLAISSGIGWHEAAVDQGAYVAGLTSAASFVTSPFPNRLGPGGGPDGFVVKLTAPTPAARGNYAIAYDPVRQVTVLFGGVNGSSLFNDTWEYNGAFWTQTATQQSPNTLPSPRYNAPMAYSPADGRMILFGGISSCGEFQTCTTGDTWAYNGTSWTPLSPAAAPGARSAFGMATDTQRSRVVLFGGQGINGLFNDTWEWTGSTWMPTLLGSPPLSSGSNCVSGALPDPRAYDSLTYDSARGRTVLFSGTTGACDFNDTWEYDGLGWRLVSAAVPGLRGNYALTFDSARGQTELTGGCLGGTPVYGDTWEWNGFSWTNKTSAYGSPGPRFNVAMTYDAARQKTVLFGGTAQIPCPPFSSTPTGDTWELVSPGPAASSSASNLQMTADESSIPAGAATVPLSSIPASRLPGLVDAPAAAPIGSTPIGSTPIGSTPIGSTPIGSTPIGSTPIGSTPIGSTDLSSSPIGSTPIGSTPIGSTGIAGLGLDTAFNGSNPLSYVLLSALPSVNWDQVLAGSALAGLPLQTLTLQQVFKDPVAGPALSKLSLAQSGLAATVLRGTRLVSVLLGPTLLSSIPIPDGQATWCAEFLLKNPSFATCLSGGAGITPPTTTLLGADIVGAPIGSTPIGSTPIGSTPIGSTPIGSTNIFGTPIGSTPIGSTNINATPLAAIVIAEITPSPCAVVACPPFAPTSTQTLGYALSQNAILPSARIEDLGAALNGMTLGELIPGLLPLSDLAWEQTSVDGMQDLRPVTAPGVHYHVNFDLACSEVRPTFSIRASLPAGFRYMAGTSQLSVAAGPAQAVADPAGAQAALTDSAQTLLWSVFPPTPCAGQITGTQHVTLNFQAQPGLDLGTGMASVSLMTPGVLTATGQAPVLVTRNFQGNTTASGAPVIQKDQLVIGHVGSVGDVDYFKLPVPAPGTRVSVYLSHIAPPADLDLVVSESATQTLLSNPIGSTPIGSTPIEDRGVATDNSTSALPPETLQDIPIGSTPIGSTPIGSTQVISVSQNRGTLDELAQFVTGTETGFYTIEVAGYNGSFTNRPFQLRVKESPAPTLPLCPAQTFPFSGNTAGTLPASIPASTKTIFLVNRSRMANLYGPGAVASMLTALNPVAQRSEVQGAVLSVDGDAGIQSAYNAWDQQPCDINAANRVVRAINTVVARYRPGAPGLRYIVIIGSDQVIPMARLTDQTTISNESNEARDLAFLTANATKANALYAAEALGNYLTDDPYTTLIETPWLSQEIYLPTLAGGRLVETPVEIQNQLNLYIAAGGLLNPQSAFVSGYDFLTSGSRQVSAALAGRVGTNTTLISDYPPSAANPLWTKDQLVANYYANVLKPADVASVNGHYNQWQTEAAAGLDTNGNSTAISGTQLLSTSEVKTKMASNALVGKVIFTMGCHGGLNVPDTLLANADQRLLDWPQFYSQQGVAAYIANLGYGYGDTAAVALSARLMALLGQQFGSDSISLGEKLVSAKHAYFDTMGVYGVYDAKALQEATLFGLPMYHLTKTAGLQPPPIPGPTFVTPGAIDPATGLPTFSVSSSPALTLNTVPGTSPAATFLGAGPLGDQTQATFYRPIQPRLDTDVTASGTTAHGIIVTSLTTTDLANFTPSISMPTIDLAAHEPPPNVLNEVFPANLVRLDRSRVLGVPRQQFVLIAGQFRPATNPTATNGIEREVQNLSANVFYSTSTNFVPPLIRQVVATRNGLRITIVVRATDASSAIKRVAVLYHQKDQAIWNYAELSPVAGTDQWTTQVTVATPSDVELFTQAQDSAGNVGYSTDKGFLFQSTATDQAPPVTTATAVPGPSGSGGFQVTVNLTSATLTPAGSTTSTTFGPLTCWSSGTVKVNLSAVDEPGGPGIRQITYAVNGGTPVVAYTSLTTATLSGSGTNTLTYFATDYDANVETAKSLTAFVGSGFSCIPGITAPALPEHGTLTLIGTISVTSQGLTTTTPFNVTFTF
jgi:streptogramin lyase